MFSIVIPLFNKEKSIKKTIQSVLAQDFVEYQIVVINDGSTDRSIEAVNQFADSRIKLINKENGGVSSARNLGIKEAKYDWIAFLDADDLWKENHLSEVAIMIKSFSNDKVFCTSFVKKEMDVVSGGDRKIDVVEDYFEKALKSHFLWTSVAVVSKSVFEKIGYFREYLTRGEDLDMWARIGLIYRIIHSNRITAIYVQEAENKASYRPLDLKKARVYQKDIKIYMDRISSKRYIIKSIYIVMKGFILKKDFKNLFLLFWRHKLVFLNPKNFVMYLKS